VKPIRTLKISISGVRGVVGDSLSPLLLNRFAQAFGTYSRGGTIVVGRDTRTTGEMVAHAVRAGLLSAGCEVVDVGVVPVPTIQFFVRRTTAAGGIAITASHNPAEWNALKFIGPKGLFLDPAEARELLDIYHQGDYQKVPSSGLRGVRRGSDALDYHVRKILEVLGPLPRSFKVAVDPCDGAASLASPKLLRALGCEVVAIHDTPDGLFPRSPEPLPENLGELRRAVKKSGADVGFAQDADADRLAVLDEGGVPLGEDYTLALAAEFLLPRKRGPFVINLSTSRAAEETARRHGCKVYRTRIGEVNVTEVMEAVGAVLGGEGNGGVIWPRVNFCRDSLTAMACVLHLMAREKMPLSEIYASLPQWRTVKRKLPLPEADPAFLLQALKEKTKEEGIFDETDGLKFETSDWWWHVRPSNTEPLLRLVAEARTEREARALADRIERQIQRLLA